MVAASAQADQSLHIAHEDALDPQPAKTSMLGSLQSFCGHVFCHAVAHMYFININSMVLTINNVKSCF